MIIKKGQANYGEIICNFDGKYFREGSWSMGKIIAHVDGKFIRYGDSPDFINAPPKLRLAVS